MQAGPLRGFEWFLAGRYFRMAQGRGESSRFLRFVIVVAVGGVAVGVASLLLSLAIVRGFSQEIEAKITGFGAHVQVESFRNAPLSIPPGMEDELLAYPEVVGVASVVQELVLLRKNSVSLDGVVLWGTEQLPAYLDESVVQGTGLQPPAGTDKEAEAAALVIGQRLAQKLDLAVGDAVTLFSMRNQRDRSATQLQPPRIRSFVIAGIYETSLADDELYVFTQLSTARDFFKYEAQQVSRLDLTLSDPALAGQVVARIEEAFGFPYMARTIYEVYRNLFAWVALQESIIPLVISVIIFVAAFNIIGTLLMLMLEKTSEIGVLSSLGASSRLLRRVFLAFGLLIGCVGVGIGAGLAFVLGVLQKRYDLIPLPEDAYYMKTAPIEMSGLDFLLVSGIALLLCALAAYIPARIASRIDPIRVIRFR